MPSLSPGERFFMDLDLRGGYADSVTRRYEASFRVEDLETGSLLANFDETDRGSVELDLTGRAGHEIRLSLTTQIEMRGDEGFGGGADGLLRRSFDSSFTPSFSLSRVVVPEPRRAAFVLAAALMAPTHHCRRGVRAAVGRIAVSK